jgi:hypothetical protein
MKLLQYLNIQNREGIFEPSFFSKWNKDKLLTFYNHPGIKVSFYLQNHCKCSHSQIL